MDLHTFFIIIHLFGVAIGAGGAFMTDIIFLSSLKDYIFSKTEIRIIKLMSVAVWTGLILLISSGLGLFLLDTEKYIASDKFILKMIIVAMLTINGALFHFKLFPILRSLEGEKTKDSPRFKAYRLFFVATGAFSIVSWTFAIILGALRSIPVSLTLGVTVYFSAVLFGVVFGTLSSRRFIS
ncbi:MAG: hypothetical protein WDZ88_03265 [Candidatus Paceibacterota bacterium]